MAAARSSSVSSTIAPVAPGAKGLAASYDGTGSPRRERRQDRRRVTISAEDPFVGGNWSLHVQSHSNDSHPNESGSKEWGREEEEEEAGGYEAEGTVTSRISRIIKRGGDDDFILSPGASQRLSTLADTDQDDMENW